MDFQYAQQPSIGNLPSSTSSEKALLWSQAPQYMVDSGYTTQAPSISSVDAFLNEDQLEAPPQQQQQQQQQYMPPPSNQQMQPLPPRPDWNNGLDMQMNMQCNNGSQMQQPQQQMQQQNDIAIENWAQNQDDSEALKAIPDLIKLLSDEDIMVVSQAAALVYQFSRKKQCCLALIESPDALSTLCNCLASETNMDTPKNILGTFYNMSLHKQAIPNLIHNPSVLPALVHFLSIPVESIVSFSITTIHNILLAYNEVKMQLRKYGAIQKMVPLLRKHANPKFLAIVVDCLQQLAFGHQESKLAILELGGPEILVDVLKTSSYPKLIFQTTRLLKVLSVCPQNKKALIGFGVIQALALHLNSTSSSELHNCLITLRNLSDAATRMNGLEGVIEILVKLVQSPEEQIVLLAAGILSNLTCNNENNKTFVMRLGAIPVLIRLIQAFIQKPELSEPCLCVLRHITNRHKDAAIALEQFKANNGVELILNLLSTQPRKWTVLKATLGLLRNLATHHVNAPCMRNQVLIEKLMQLTFESFNELQRTQVIDDVKLVDLIDFELNILSNISKDFSNQILMRDMNCIGFVVQLFYSNVQKIATLAAQILVDFVHNKECVEVVDAQPGIQMFLSKFLNYPPAADDQLSNYAKMIMQCIQEHKNAKMRMMQQQHHMQQQQQQQQQMNNYQQWPQQQQTPVTGPPAQSQANYNMHDPFTSNDQQYMHQSAPIYSQNQMAPGQQQQQQQMMPMQHHQQQVFHQQPPLMPPQQTYDGLAIL